MFNHTSFIDIPAYDNANNGLLVEFKLTAILSDELSIHANGKVAKALQKNFIRIIDIMSSMKESWSNLLSINYLLECNSNQFIVKDSKSSSMALSIALINVNRALRDQTTVLGFSGTGILRIDGSFDSSHHEEKKHFATKSLKRINKFITPHECKSLFELEKLMFFC